MSYKALPIKTASHAGSYPCMEMAVKSSTDSWLKIHSKNGPLVLYHYTGGDGLKGIISERSMRCSYLDVLNDPMEYRYGENLIKDMISNYIGKEQDERIKKALTTIIDFTSVRNFTHKIFIACFCENNNLLSQWRGYGDNGVGYNLGFMFDSETQYYLDPEHLDKTQNVILRKVVYNIDEQTKLIDDYLLNLIEGLKKTLVKEGVHKIADPKFDYSPISILCCNLLIDMMLSMKNPKFEEENEWRLLRVTLNSDARSMYKFQVNKNELFPYLDTNFYKKNNDSNEFPLQNIMIGPMLEEEKSKSVLGMFIARNIYGSSHPIKLKEGIHIEHAGYTLRG
jgi:hypothetical protein